MEILELAAPTVLDRVACQALEYWRRSLPAEHADLRAVDPAASPAEQTSAAIGMLGSHRVSSHLTSNIAVDDGKRAGVSAVFFDKQEALH